MIASFRALEDEEEDRLFEDPLAHVLAGDRAMRRANLRVKVCGCPTGLMASELMTTTFHSFSPAFS